MHATRLGATPRISASSYDSQSEILAHWIIKLEKGVEETWVAGGGARCRVQCLGMSGDAHVAPLFR